MGYKNIICPVDGTELGDKALAEASYLCKVTGAKLTVLHIIEKAYRMAHVITDSDEWKKIHGEWLKEGEELVKREKDRLKSDGLDSIEMILREGDAAYEIVAQAIEQRADLIVMASHRYTPVGKFFMGSHIDKVTKQAPCPVLWVFK